MKRLAYFLLMLCSLSSSAQNIILTGSTNKADALVRLIAYNDLLTNTGKTIATTRSDEQGHFILEGTVSRTLSARIFVNLESVDIYLTPNATYDIEIYVPEQNDNVSYFEREQPAIRVKKATDKGLYRQIVQSDRIINTYLMEHINQIYRGRQARHIDSIQARIDRELPDIKSDYVKSHVCYKLASIRLAISTDGGKKVAKDYFGNSAILYATPAYMDLFKELFGNYFNKGTYDNHALNEAFLTGPAAFRQYIDTDPLMKGNPRLAELVTIYNLQQLLNADRETRYYAKAHLEQIKKNTAYAEHKTIIGNIFAKRDQLAPDSDAPDFELTDSDGNAVKLSQYKQDWVLIQFVDGFSPVSERQFSNLIDLHRQWGNDVQILTIATKDKMDFYKQQFSEKHYDWPLLCLGNNILLLEAYNVKTFPEYILIKPETKIGAAPAPTPDQHLDALLEKMIGMDD